MVRVLIETPNNYKPERRYIAKVLLGEMLGLEWEWQAADRQDVRLTVQAHTGELTLSDILFSNPTEYWLHPSSLPERPLMRWDARQLKFYINLTDFVVPLIYGENKPIVEVEGKSIRLPIDIFGSAFFMLTRYEEAVLPDRDEHDRFPAIASLAYKEGFLERPIVDEYIEILWACMKRLWPTLERRQMSYQVSLSHDIDNPSGSVGKPWRNVFKSFAGDLIKRKDFYLAGRRLKAKILKNYDLDPYNTFNFIMDIDERYGLKSIFYFKAGMSNSCFDENYALEMSFIQEIMLRIHRRGHKIGLHPSYESYKDINLLKDELKKLLYISKILGIKQNHWGSRQHFLRWENPITWQNMENIKLDYDSTLCFAENVGFRCGTCHTFSIFNLKTKEDLRLLERPLIVMEMTLFDRKYMNFKKNEQVIEMIEKLSRVCRQYNGTFSLLWHNVNLAQSWQKKLYIKIIEIIL